MFFKNCGKEDESDTGFCADCGRNLQVNALISSVQTSVYAGFWRRLAAYFIDGVLLGIVVGIPCYIITIIIVASRIQGLDGIDEYNTAVPNQTAIVGGMMTAFFICGILGTAASWLYFALMESSSKQATLGKMALSIKVTNLDGNRISFGRATGRYFGKILSGMIMDIGFIMTAFTEKKQGLHDMIAKTLVVNK